ncbi:hypothetical protein KDW_55090 [Dictyobacter vulcani]|uniref:N-acetyltransferase domain-containing protein n=1 Tax=Dictyobacter vulcani TaxID=2607529 RepID=A0A5J4KXS0_9CHLR|nr:GNAT family N-acetyltransferase [Dictyobacter vulcani]GER91347.1 hypothetical protein KDW_55090 [Dictyobacter vulcani]
MVNNVDTYRFSNALGYTFEQLAEMHNESFTGYFVPITMTPAQVADFWRVNQINATRCVVMHAANNAFVGMARMGTRGTRSWCGGFGIVPEFRGTGASTLLANEMVRVALNSGVEQLQLEVLSQNSRAIKLYERAGFVKQRRLLGLQITTSELPVSTVTMPVIERVALESCLSLFQHHTDRQSWGRELASLLAMDTEAFVTSSPDGQQSAIIVQRANDTIRLLAVLLPTQSTHAVLATLLHAIAADATTIQIYNEPEDGSLFQLYLDLGFTEFFSQYEMFLNL